MFKLHFVVWFYVVFFKSTKRRKNIVCNNNLSIIDFRPGWNIVFSYLVSITVFNMMICVFKGWLNQKLRVIFSCYMTHVLWKLCEIPCLAVRHQWQTCKHSLSADAFTTLLSALNCFCYIDREPHLEP